MKSDFKPEDALGYFVLVGHARAGAMIGECARAAALLAIRGGEPVRFMHNDAEYTADVDAIVRLVLESRKAVAHD